MLVVVPSIALTLRSGAPVILMNSIKKIQYRHDQAKKQMQVNIDVI